MTHLLCPALGFSPLKERKTLCGMGMLAARIDAGHGPCPTCYRTEHARKDAAFAGKTTPPAPSVELIDPIMDAPRWRDVRVQEYVNQGWTDHVQIAERVIAEHEQLVLDLQNHLIKTKEKPPKTAPDQQFAEATKETPLAINFKQTMIDALKDGAASGAVKALSDEVAAALEEEYPQIAFLPPELRHLLVCFAINTVANIAPDMPGAKSAAALTERAFQGLMTQTVTMVTQKLLSKVRPAFARLVESEKENAKLLRGVKA